jgi:hypothetical protein
MSATAFIEFIGIVALTANTASLLSTLDKTKANAILEVAPTTGIVAVMPAIPTGQNIPPHTPMIVFPTGALDTTLRQNPLGWIVSQLRPGLSYVALAPSDRITFENLPAQTFLIDKAWSDSFPHLKSEWNTTRNVDLQSGYTAASGYSASTGVFTLTKGSVSACTPHDHPGRADTLVTVQTSGAVDIVAGSGITAKRLRLRIETDSNVVNNRERNVITIANVPLDYAKDPTMSNGNHFEAYCAMANAPVTNCQPPLAGTLRDCPFTPAMIAVNPHVHDGHGVASFARTAPATPRQTASGHPQETAATPVVGPTAVTARVVGAAATVTPNPFAGSADCSNTQWP